jgi:hypothetical protein
MAMNIIPYPDQERGNNDHQLVVAQEEAFQLRPTTWLG